MVNYILNIGKIILHAIVFVVGFCFLKFGEWLLSDLFMYKDSDPTVGIALVLAVFVIIIGINLILESLNLLEKTKKQISVFGDEIN